MAEKCSWFMWILKREDREFREAVTEQVGTIFPSPNGLDNVGIFKILTDAGIAIACKNENSGYACL